MSVSASRQSDEPASWERRQLLKAMSASLALAGCSGPPAEKILPFARSPEYTLPGESVFYATSLSLGGYGRGVLVKNTDGRPIKVEGNPEHPASLGGTDIFAQASVLNLWDPTRSRVILQNGRLHTRESLVGEIAQRRADLDRKKGAGLRLLTRTVCSPTFADQIEKILARYPNARWHQYDPLHDDATFAATRELFERPLLPIYRFDRAQRVVAIDADFLQGDAMSVRYARDFSRRRIPDGGSMSRVFAVESTPGLIGAAADERFASSPVEIERMVHRLAAHFGLRAPIEAGDDATTHFERKLLADISQHGNECLIVPGLRLSAQAHVLIHAINLKLGAVQHCMDFIEPVELRPENQIDSLINLCKSMTAGEVDTLVILDGNPVYDAPADVSFANCLERVPHSVHLASHVNETSKQCAWHIPLTHEFEHWSDVRTFDGTLGIVQPLIAPLYGGLSPHELLASLLPESKQRSHDIVRGFHQGQRGAKKFASEWSETLRMGFVAGSAFTPVRIAARTLNVSEPPQRSDAMTLNLVADDSVRDGEYSNNGWLQELPKPLTKITWDNCALVNVEDAKRLGVESGDLLEIETEHTRAIVPAWLLPGHARDCISVQLGYGRKEGAIAKELGVDAYPLRRSTAPWNVPIRSVKKVSGRHKFATRQHHDLTEGREIVRAATFAEFSANAAFATATESQRVPSESMYKEYPYDSYRWGMSIDLNACIGCNACTIACQAENNIPIVGAEQVRRGREMHWIRVDRYYSEEGRTDFQPVPCMHCEHAPCEEVCPVGATVHDSEGLNVQVYNRCVGTRFCSNNCPYKVRRFNFFWYANRDFESLKALQNPDVTVRQRGVMEKCNYCLQRVTRGRLEADRLGRKIQDGEVVTACQAVCPTKAIVFGDLNTAGAEVVKAKSSKRTYSLLAELNTRPRTTYLARVTNPLESESPATQRKS